MPPHGCVHRGSNEDRTLAGQQDAGQQAIREAMGPASQGGGTEWCHQHQLRPFRQLDVQRPAAARAPLVSVLIAAVAAKTGQSHRTDEVRGTGRDHTADLGPCLRKSTDQEWSLDSRNAATGGDQ
jgi:hypothetical protein